MPYSYCNFEKMESKKAVLGLDMLKSTKKIVNICESCVDGKAANNSHPTRGKSSKEVLELIHMDLTGPITPVGIDGSKHGQVLVDFYSGAIWMYTMKN